VALQALPQVAAEFSVGENNTGGDKLPDSGLNAAVKRRTAASAVLNGRQIWLTHTGCPGDFGLGEPVAHPMVAQCLTVHRIGMEPIYVPVPGAEPAPTPGEPAGAPIGIESTVWGVWVSRRR
jgi:hypothetical protein